MKYLMSFKNITPEEYQRLINNKNRIFDMIFKTPERLNKYRSDKNIYNEIKQNKKLRDYDNVFHENLDKYFIENNDKKKIEDVSRYNYNIIKNKEKELEDKDNEMKNLRKSYIRNKYGNKYKFDNDINILESLERVFNENDILYNPYTKSKETQVIYLLHKLENDTRVDKNLYDYFYNTLKDNIIT